METVIENTENPARAMRSEPYKYLIETGCTNDNCPCKGAIL